MKSILLTLSFFSFLSIFAQKEDHVWVLGGLEEDEPAYNATIFDFNETPSVLSTVATFPGMYLTNTSICDAEGNLLLYSNGRKIFNRDHNTILNGDNFHPAGSIGKEFGHNAPQGALFLPFPGHPNEYIFTLLDRHYYFDDLHGFSRNISKRLTYSIINVVTGSPIVTEKRTTLSTDSLMFGGLTAIRHGNGQDWWVIAAPGFGGNEFQKFLLTEDGIDLHSQQVIGNRIYPEIGQQAALSPNGEWLAYYTWHRENLTDYEIFHSIHLYRFDRCTGELSEPTHVRKQVEDPYTLYSPESRGGLAFSPDSKLLYVNDVDTVFQFDLMATAPLENGSIVAIYDGFLDDDDQQVKFAQMKLAPDGKIYIGSSINYSRYLHIIEQPNLTGLSCEVQQHGILLPAFNFQSLPHHPVFHPTDSIACGPFVHTTASSGDETKVSIFPNPFKGQLNISVQRPLNFNGDFLLFNTAVEQIVSWKLQTGNNTLPIDGLPTGIYFYEIWQANLLLDSGKLVKVE